MLVKAGVAVDELIDQLTPMLQPGDILIDGGNSLFTDTIRRAQQAESDGSAVCRFGRLRWRGGRAAWTFVDARRQPRRMAPHPSDLPGHLRANAGRRALLRLDGRGRGGSLREDDPQRHRVRRHAAYLRGLRLDETRPRHEQCRDASSVRRLECARARQLPDRDHAGHSWLPEQGWRGHHRPDPGCRRPEGHRQVDRRPPRSTRACRSP